MVSKITSLNRTALFEIKKRWYQQTTLSLMVLTMLLLNGNLSYAQSPVFTTPLACPGTATVTLPVGGGTITFTNANIAGFLMVDANDPGGGAVTYSTDVASVDCTDEGSMIPITVTATNVEAPNETSICLINATISSGGGLPTATCVAGTFDVNLSGTGTVIASDVNNGSFSCSGITSLMVNSGSGSAASVMYTCDSIGMRTLNLEVTDGFGTSTCTVNISVNDDVDPTVMCPSNTTAMVDANCQFMVPDLTMGLGEADNCDPMPGVSQPSIGTLVSGPDTTIVISVSDASSNTVTCNVTITAVDNTDPLCVAGPFTLYLDGAGTATLEADSLDGGSTDNCGLVNLSLDPMDQTMYTCADLGSNMVTLIATDGSMNTSNCMATFTVADSIPPTPYPNLSGFGNSSGDCFATVSWPDTLVDNCATGVITTITSVTDEKNNPITTLTASGVHFGDFPVGVSTVRYTATDGFNTVVDSFTITVTDIEPPLISCPPAMVNQEIASCNTDESVPSFIGLATISDNCSPNLSVRQEPDFGTLLVGDLGLTLADGESYPVKIYISDNDNLDSCEFIVTLVENNAPIPDSPGATLTTVTSECGPIVVTAPTAQNACGDIICGTPFPVDPAVWNQVPGSGPCPGTIVRDTIDGTAGDIGSGTPGVSISFPTPCGNPAPDIYTFSLNGPTGTIGTNTTIESLTLDITHSWDSDLEINLIAPDGTTTLNLVDNQGGAGDNFNNTTFIDGNPSITTGLPDFSGIFEAQGGTFATTFDGLSSGGVWTLQIIDEAGGDCGWLNSWSMVFSAIPAGQVPEYEFELGSHVITWIYDDGAGNTSSQLQQIIVNPDTEAPMVDCQSAVVTLDANGMATMSPMGFLPTSITLVGGNNGNFAYIGGETVLSITAQNTTVLSFDWLYTTVDPFAGFDNIGYSVNGVYTELSDNNGDSGSATVPLSPGDVFTLEARTDDNQFGAPVGTFSNFTPGIAADWAFANWNLSLNNSDGSANSSSESATDNCNDPSLISISANGSSLPLTFDCTNLGNNSIAVMATDTSGNVGTCNTFITVLDNSAPTLFNVSPAFQNATCSFIPDTTGMNVFATDNCNVFSINYNETTTQAIDPAICTHYNYTITRTWTATDDSGNSTSASQTINVSDLLPPTFNPFLPASQTIGAGANCDVSTSVTLVQSDINDNCADFDDLDIDYVINFAGGGSVTGSGLIAFATFPLGTNTVTFTATDPCGNPSTYTHTIIVEDQTPPIASCTAGSLTVALPASGSITIPATFVDNGSADNCNPVSLSLFPNTFDCDDADGITARDVTLTVTDDVTGETNTCTSSIVIQDNIAPDVVCQNITVTLDENSMASITTDDLDPTGATSDNCTAAGDLILGLSQSTFGVADLGMSVPVTMTAEDENGTIGSETCLVTVAPPPTCFEIGAEIGGAGEIVSVPITVEDFTSITSFQFTLQIDDEPVGEFIGVSGINPALSNLFLEQLVATDSTISNIDTTFVPDINGMDSIAAIDTTYMEFFDNISVSWQQLMGGPVTLADGETAFFVDILLTGNLNDFSFLSNNPNLAVTPPEVVFDFSGNLVQTTPCFFNGGIQIGELIIAGDIYNEFGHAISLSKVYLRDLPILAPNIPPIDSVTTGSDGYYEFTINVNGDYQVQPTKDINWSNGIDILDVAGIQRHAVGNQFVTSAYKKIAADVSDDGLITTFDAVLLNQFLSSAFMTPPPPNQSWRFSDAKETLVFAQDAVVPSFSEVINFANLVSDTLGNDFVAVKIGDIAGLAADTLQFSAGGGDTRGELEFVIEDRPLKAGELYTIDVRANDFNQLIGYQWVLEFDPYSLEYLAMDKVSLSNLSDANIGLTLVDEGQLIMTWYDAYATTNNVDDVLFTLTFEAKQDDVQLSKLMRLGQLEQLPAIAYNETEDPIDVNLVFTDYEGPAIDQPFALMQNRPNPFKDETLISFTLPEASEGSLTIMDLSGRVVKVFKGEYNKGYNEITIGRSELPAAGVLYYQLDTPEHSATRKMIIID